MAETTTPTTPTARKSTATARRKTAATRRSTTAKKAATTRATRQASANLQPARNRVQQVQDFAERAVLVQVGVALEARDRVVGTVGTIADTYTSRTQAERQLKKFERRGATARTRLEREIRKTRTRVERELRQRRQRIERTVKRNRTRLEREVRTARRDFEKQAKGLRRNVAANGELVGAEARNAVQGAVKSTAKLVSEATERVGAVS